MIPRHIVSFISNYPMFRMSPSSGERFILNGSYEGWLNYEQHGEIYVDYELEIHVEQDFPSSLPTVMELSNKIGKRLDNHVNSDGTICLGSPIRLKMVLKRKESLTHFFEACMLPYFYAVTIKIDTGNPFIFGELAHGRLGLLQDFQEMFELDDVKKVYAMLKLLSMNRKDGNKQLCPCGCEKRVSICQYFKKVQQMRKSISRSEWEKQSILIK